MFQVLFVFKSKLNQTKSENLLNHDNFILFFKKIQKKNNVFIKRHTKKYMCNRFMLSTDTKYEYRPNALVHFILFLF